MSPKKSAIGWARSRLWGRTADFGLLPRPVRRPLSWVALVSTLAIATAWLGWWAIPIVAAVWGAFQPGRSAWWLAGLAAAVSWGTLLVMTALRGPIGELSQRVGDVLGLPGFALVLLTLVFPALLAASSAELAAALRRRGGRKDTGA